jgi:predicted transposase YdaD
MEARLQSRRLRRYAEEIWSATYILLGLRYSRELARQLLHGVRSMKESVTYQAILEEGEAMGEVKGALAEARKFLLRQGRVRFGPPDALVVAALEGIGSLERLEELGERLLSAANWEELLGLSAPRRPHAQRRRKA